MLVVLAASLATDLALEGCVRLAHCGYRVPQAVRRVMAGTVLVLVVWSMRPATGMTAVPPPSVRITGVEPSVPAVSDIDHPVRLSAKVPATYTVERGDCLWRIARKLMTQRYGTAPSAEVSILWRSIYEANRQVIGDDPDLIMPGQTLAVPGGW
jgi:nucleoid-associated protein YgaU